MRIDSEQLTQHLSRGLKSLYVVYGEELLLALEAADRIRAKALEQGFDERRVLIAESNFDWGELDMVSNSLSLFAPNPSLLATRALPDRLPCIPCSPHAGNWSATHCIHTKNPG